MSTKPPAAPTRRYVIKDVVGKGGMGVVYRAYDNETRRDVTLKCLLDITDPAMLQLFRKECEVLSHINHPNIVDIYDVGELDDGKPYFVMPMLPGVTLDKLIAGATQRLSLERTVDIMAQACRGLHAAHEQGLVHRDVKPSNIFVLEDDSVKIIDFGVAHLASNNAQTSVKGTLFYMAPEQLQMKKPTPASDLFSLAVVCYEALTRKRPFDGATSEEVSKAILNRNPPAASDLNPAVSRAVSQVIHKGMAKQAFHRFASAREFAENLQKALRGEVIEIFDESRIVTRIERSRSALEGGELDFASEVLGGLEAEGYIHPDMGPLRRQIDQVRREKAVGKLLDNARRCFREEEHQLALQKIQEILNIDPHNAQAITLRAEIENKRSSEQIGKWIRLAQQHLDNHAFDHARKALEDILALRPEDTTARKMLSDVKIREEEYVRVRAEKEKLYQEAMDAWRKGEVTAALSDLERVIELDRKAPDTSNPERAASYQKFYNQVRSDHDALKGAYEEARRQLHQRNFQAALALCEDALAKYPGHALLQSLKVDVEEGLRQDLSAYIARIDREVEAEPDLDRRVSILREALTARPGESHFERALQLTTSKRDLVNSIVVKARAYEERRQFNEALNQWEMLRTIYASFPGLTFEVERIIKRRDQQSRADAKSRWVEQIDRSLSMGEWQRALDLAHSGLAEFPEDPELKPLVQLAEQGLTRAAEAQALLDEGKAQCAGSDLEKGIATLRRALEVDERDSRVRAALLEALLKQARTLVETDPAKADQLAVQALEIEPSNALAKSLRSLIEDRTRDQFVDQSLAQARQFQASGDIEKAAETLRPAVEKFPQEPRLLQLKTSLDRNLSEVRRAAERKRDLEQVRELEAKASAASTSELTNLIEKTVSIANRHASDKDFETVVNSMRQRAAALEATKPKLVTQPAPPPPPVVAAPPPSKAEPKKAVPKVAKPELPPPPPPRAEKPAATATQAPPGKSFDVRQLVPMLGGVVLVAVLAFGGYKIFHKEPPPPPAVTVSVALASEPSGATVLVDGASAGQTPYTHTFQPGPHKVTIAKDGYEPVEHDWSILPEFKWDRTDRLEPLPAVVHLTTDIPAAKVLLDGTETEPAVPGVPLDLTGIKLTDDHKLQLVSKSAGAELSFKTLAGDAPDVSLAPGSKAPALFLLSTLGRKAKFISATPVKVSHDGGKTFEDAGPNGVTWSDLSAGATITVDEGHGGEPRNLIVPDGRAPALHAFVFAGNPAKDMGGLQIEAGDGDFTVLVDKKKMFAKKSPPYWVVYNVPAGKHEVQIKRDGATIEPSSVTVEVRPQQAAPVKFKVTTSVAATIALTVQGGPLGTQVLQGGRSIGTLTPPRGEFRAELPGGVRELVFRKDGYRPKTLSRAAAQGDWVIPADQTKLELIQGSLTLTLTDPPRGVRVKIAQSGGVVRYEGRTDFDVFPVSLTLPKGLYNLSASARDYDTLEVGPIEIDDGEQKPISLKLTKRSH